MIPLPLRPLDLLMIVTTKVLDIPEPSFAVALTVTVPAPIAVSKPFELIVAIPTPSATDHVTLVFVAFVGVTVAVN
ncbi:hypothetical protein D3C81_2293710 [compost metagenome]